MRKHYMVWGTTREGMSEMGRVGKAAFVEGGQIMLVTVGAIQRGDMPPGFQRFLTDAEFAEEGLDGGTMVFAQSDISQLKDLDIGTAESVLANSKIKMLLRDHGVSSGRQE